MNDLLKRLAEAREQAKESKLDSMIDDLPWHDADTKAEEKGPMFSDYRPLLAAIVAVLIIAILAAVL